MNFISLSAKHNWNLQKILRLGKSKMTRRTTEISVKRDSTSDPELMKMTSDLKRSSGNRANQWFLTNLRSTELIKKPCRNWKKALKPSLSMTTMILCSQLLFDESLERQWNCCSRFCHQVLIKNRNAKDGFERSSAIICKRHLSAHIESSWRSSLRRLFLADVIFRSLNSRNPCTAPSKAFSLKWKIKGFWRKR